MTKQSKTFAIVGVSALAVVGLILLLRPKAAAATLPADVQPEGNLLDKLLAMIPGGATRADVEAAYKKPKSTVVAGDPIKISEDEFYNPDDYYYYDYFQLFQTPDQPDTSGLTIDDTIYG